MSTKSEMEESIDRDKDHFAKIILIMGMMMALLMAPIQSAFAESRCNLGMIDDTPVKIIKLFTPLMEYLKTKGFTGKVVVAKDKDAMIEMFKNGQVDFMFESPYLAIEIMDKTGAIPTLIREKNGVKDFNSVIFVKKDSPIQKLSDLNGKVIAFEELGSTSSYILPRHILRNAGLTLKESKKPNPGVLCYYFTGDDKNTIYHVKAGRAADCGGIKKTKIKDDSAFRIIAESAYVPRHVVLLRKDFPVDNLKEALLGMKSDPEGKKVLSKIKTPTGFSEFDGDPIVVMNSVVRDAMGL